MTNPPSMSFARMYDFPLSNDQSKSPVFGSTTFLLVITIGVSTAETTPTRQVRTATTNRLHFMFFNMVILLQMVQEIYTVYHDDKISLRVQNIPKYPEISLFSRRLPSIKEILGKFLVSSFGEHWFTVSIDLPLN